MNGFYDLLSFCFVWVSWICVGFLEAYKEEGGCLDCNNRQGVSAENKTGDRQEWNLNVRNKNPRACRGFCVLNVKAEVHYIAILYDVFLAFQAPFASFFGAGFAFVLNKVVVRDDFRADKTLFKIGMDCGGSLRRCSTHFYC